MHLRLLPVTFHLLSATDTTKLENLGDGLETHDLSVQINPINKRRCKYFIDLTMSVYSEVTH